MSILGSRRFNEGQERLFPAFTLVELLVVMGIVALVVGLLVPGLGSARAQAKMTACASNLRQLGLAMLIYSNSNRGQLFPIDAGGAIGNPPPNELWFVYVLKAQPPPSPLLEQVKYWTPPVLTCPADDEPAQGHTYVLNDHLNERGIKYWTKPPSGVNRSQVVVAGEKFSQVIDYYVQPYPGRGSDYSFTVNTHFHGIKRGSNALFIDMHVSSYAEKPTLPGGLDPWDIPPD